ncbi:MAG: hypothetical protein AAGI69_12035 [Cyanobacteria bacterium P01_H01_bin.21]
MGRDRVIETYIQRLLDWEAPITAESLNALAAEVGLGPDDIAAVKQKAQDHLERGRNYLDFNCPDEAIEELTQANALDPLNFEALQTLTYAYDQRYGKRKDPDDKKQAIALAKRCLELNPSNPESVMLISALEQEANGRKRLIWLGVAALVVLVGARPVMNLITTRTEVQQLTEDAGSAEDATGPGAEDRPDTDAISAEVDIPIIFDEPGLTLEPRLSRLDNYEDSSYYTLQGVLLNDSNQEIDGLRLKVEYLDKAGVVIATDSKDAIADNDATVRPGDHHAIDLIQKITPDLDNVRFSVTTIDELPAPDSYNQATPIKYTWGFKQPTQLTFNLSARNENFNVYDISESAYFDAEWAITNTGDTAIRQLKFQTDFYNQQGKLILSKDLLAVYGSDAPMFPGEVRPLRVIKSMDQDYDRYEVTVLEAE